MRFKGIQWKLIYTIVVVIGFLFLFWRAKYGFCFNDEPFCVTLGQRLANGDALIVNEWHGTQLFSGIMLPFYKLYRIFSDSNEGILLFLRYTYCLLWWGTCFVISLLISKNYLQSVCVFLYLVLFSPLDYMTISYTSVGLMCALGISCYTYLYITEKIKESGISIIIFSALWVGLALSSPFMVFVYVIMLGIGILNSVSKNQNKYHKYFEVYKKAFWILFCIAVCYIVLFVLMRTSLVSIIKSVPYIFSDPEHTNINLFQSIKVAFKAVCWWSNNHRLILLLSIIAFCARKYIIKVFIFALSCVFYLYELYLYLQMNFMQFNGQMISIVLLGIVAYLLTVHKNAELFVSFYGMSVLYTVCNGMASNTGAIAVGMTTVVAGAAAVVFILELGEQIYNYYNVLKGVKVLATLCICIVLVSQIGSEVYTRLHRQYWDAPFSELNTTIKNGSAKGLVTTQERALKYEEIYRNLDFLLNQYGIDEGSFLSFTSAPYIYLDADLEFATFSAWSFGYGDKLVERLLSYQEINPDDKPEMIFCYSEEDILPIVDGYRKYEFNKSYLFVIE